MTISSNSAIGGIGSPNGVGVGGGINAMNGSLLLLDCIVADNPSGSDFYSSFGAITDGGDNISSDISFPLTAPGSMNNTNPELGPLGNYGGPTETVPLLAGSPAIDAGGAGGCPATDQRGVPRPGGGVCDIGAFEYAPAFSVPGDYTTNADGTTITIIAYTGDGGAVTIPTNINDLPVTGIGNDVFASNTSVTSVMIPGSVTSIGAEAFYLCYGLTSVTIPNSVTNIGEFAFQGCTSLTSVTIPGSVTSIGYQLFYSCTSLTNVTIANGVTSIGAEAFYGCSSLTNVAIPSSITNIGDYAFANCASLTGVYFTGNPPTADSTVFSGDNDVTVYYLSGSTGWGSSLAGVPAFLWDPPVPFGYTTNADGTISIADYMGSQGQVSIPDEIDGLPVTGIGDYAFANGSGLSGIAIPGTVTSIGVYAFKECISLTNLTIPDSVTSIGDYAFYGCSGLTSVTIPGNVTDMGLGVFYSCTSLTNVTIANGVTSIGAEAFYGCPSLTNVAIPSSITNIGDYAFANCASLTGVYFTGNPPTADSTVFSSDENVTVYYLPGTTGWGDFSANTDLTPVLWKPLIQSGSGSLVVQSNQFEFNINWTSGQVIVVEVTTNLASPVWTPLQTNTLTNDSFHFTELLQTNSSGRFYRISSP